MDHNSNPFKTSIPITPSDDTADNYATGEASGIYVGTAGDVSLVDASGTACLFTGLLAGYWYPFVHIRVNNTDTTAEDLRALYN